MGAKQYGSNGMDCSYMYFCTFVVSYLRCERWQVAPTSNIGFGKINSFTKEFADASRSKCDASHFLPFLHILHPFETQNFAPICLLNFFACFLWNYRKFARDCFFKRSIIIYSITLFMPMILMEPNSRSKRM